MEPFDKIIYTIGDAAHIADVKPYVLRYWETEFEMLRPEKSVTGQRCYRPKDLRIVLTLKRLLHQEGFTIVGARKRLSEMSENEWAPFPPISGSEQDLSLPPGRSIVGTVDEPESPPESEEPVPMPETVSLETTRVEADSRLTDEWNRLWNNSVRILNKYLN